MSNVSVFAAVQAYLSRGEDLFLIEIGWRAMIAMGILLVSLSLFRVAVPYGRHTWKGGLLLPLPAKLGWFVQEAPALCVPLFLITNVGGKHLGKINANTILLGMFLLHYVHRVLIYPLYMKGKPSPFYIVLFAFFFCTINGYMQGRWLTHFQDYDESWLYHPVFVVGVALFLLGQAINIHSDLILQGLRKPGETGYKIPYGGMFEYVSAPNYFGESLEWAGYALACWSLPAMAFALHTCLFLGTRAYNHHQFYLKTFEKYPKERKAFIPFVW